MLCVRGERCARTTRCPWHSGRRPYPRHGGTPPTTIRIGEPALRIPNEEINAPTVWRCPSFRARQPAPSSQREAQSTALLLQARARRCLSTSLAVTVTCDTSAWCVPPQVRIRNSPSAGCQCREDWYYLRGHRSFKIPTRSVPPGWRRRTPHHRRRFVRRTQLRLAAYWHAVLWYGW